jgi:hypothetical protein
MNRTEFAWLVEGGGHGPPQYLRVMEESHNGAGFCWMPRFTTDPNAALRFSRSVDAETLAEQLSFPGGLKAVEHGWINTTHRPQSEPSGAGVTDKMVNAALNSSRDSKYTRLRDHLYADPETNKVIVRKALEAAERARISQRDGNEEDGK